MRKVKIITGFCIWINLFFGLFVEVSHGFNLANLNGKNGFFANGVGGYNSGDPVTGIGDVNGDGIDDFLIGAQANKDKNLFKIFIVFGSKNNWPLALDLGNLNGKNGCTIIGQQNNLVISASAAGDVNGDSLNDILIGVGNANNFTGQSYVIFGKKGQWPDVIQLDKMSIGNGFALKGINLMDQSGQSVSGIGDFNGDAIDDFIIGAPGANNGAGESYLIFGNKKGFPQIFNLSSLNGTNGVIFEGIHSHELSGFAVGGGIDVNGDGFKDVMIGAPGAAGAGSDSIGRTYVAFGGQSGWPAVIMLKNLNGVNGFMIIGISSNDFSGFCVSGGDVNADGVDDIVIGAPGINNMTGKAYAIFGRKDTQWPAQISATNLDGNNGFLMIGIPADRSGAFVSSGEDVSGDGVDDIIVGAPAANRNTGEGYLVLGKKEFFLAKISLVDLKDSTGFIITGALNTGGYGISIAGDVNADGLGDIIIGSQSAIVNGSSGVGQSYILFGFPDNIPPNPTIMMVEEILVGLASLATLTSFVTFSYYGYLYYCFGDTELECF
ncbi:MAG: hypothetical protein C5B43_03445 [Verrucomicrobia bacterium]|nr:MAG: hypothetical protein C5B43_03445 [Verrucomicrobiota bacterium]